MKAARSLECAFRVKRRAKSGFRKSHRMRVEVGIFAFLRLAHNDRIFHLSFLSLAGAVPNRNRSSRECFHNEILLKVTACVKVRGLRQMARPVPLIGFLYMNRAFFSHRIIAYNDWLMEAGILSIGRLALGTDIIKKKKKKFFFFFFFFFYFFVPCHPQPALLFFSLRFFLIFGFYSAASGGRKIFTYSFFLESREELLGISDLGRVSMLQLRYGDGYRHPAVLVELHHSMKVSQETFWQHSCMLGGRDCPPAAFLP